MSAEEHFRKLERMYHSAPCNQEDAPRLEISEGAATVTMTVRPPQFHALDALHGAFYFKMLDDAAFFAVASLIPESLVLTVSFNIYLVRPVTEGTLRAEGTAVSKTKNLSIGEGTLYNDAGVVVARGSGSFATTSIPLADVERYNS